MSLRRPRSLCSTRCLGTTSGSLLMAIQVLVACGPTTKGTRAPQPLTPPPATAGLVDHFDCARLNDGLYWFGAGSAKQLAIGQPVPGFYDPAKKTVIFAHGWKPNSYKSRDLETFAFDDPDTRHTEDLAQAWRDSGWNTGVFYWQQWGDEDEVVDAERKIWSATEGVGMRWRRCDGSYVTGPATIKDPYGLRAAGTPPAVGDLFVETLATALHDFHGAELRLVGHSLGSQLAMHGAQMLAAGVEAGKLPPALRPTRVAQLDPWWSQQAAPHHSTAPAVLAAAKELIAGGTSIEIYQTSNVLTAACGDLNVDFFRLVGANRQTPGFLRASSAADLIGLWHAVAPKLYFLSFTAPPPVACSNPSTCNRHVRSAAMSTADLTAQMLAKSVYTQTAGQLTATAADDVYRIDAQFNPQWDTPDPECRTL